MIHLHKIGEHFGLWDTEAQSYIAGAVDARDLSDLLIARRQESVLIEMPRMIVRAVKQGCSEGACHVIPPLWTAPGLDLSFDSLVPRILSTISKHQLNPCATPEEISFTEEQMGAPLPPDYREFLATVSNGATLYMTNVLFGVGPQQHRREIGTIKPWPDNWAYQVRRRFLPDTVEVRTGGSVPRSSLVPFCPDSNGNDWCFSLSDGALYYWNEVNDTLYGKTDSFLEWLALLVRFEDEVIRSISTQATIYYELRLG
ncbi:MAG: SMI1/KNR4 family protein [Bacillota bacterium]